MNIFAIVETGGKQYVVEAGQNLTVEKLPQKERDVVVFDKVLLVVKGKETRIGTPYIQGATIEAKLTKQGRTKKIRIMRYHSKTRHRRRKGHRQPYSNVTISKIK